MTDLEKEFKDTICALSEDIDPGEEHDWFALSLGWALAKGVSIEEAYDFALRVRYHYHYWC